MFDETYPLNECVCSNHRSRNPPGFISEKSRGILFHIQKVTGSVPGPENGYNEVLHSFSSRQLLEAYHYVDHDRFLLARQFGNHNEFVLNTTSYII
jgi:hypothetical protein